MIEVCDLAFSYSGRPVLKNISFSAEKGEFVSILGANGAGKSTLFKCMINVLPEYTGKVLLDGRDTHSMKVRELAQHIAYIPQMSSSSFNYSVEDIVLMGTTAGIGTLRNPGSEEKQRAINAMDRMGISCLRKRCYHQLSGGERQLVTIARALAQEAEILLLDEPSASLDFGNQMLISEQARKLASEGYTVIQTTHDPEKAHIFSDKIIAMKNGNILSQGTPSEVLTGEVIEQLYGIAVETSSLYEDKVRVFTPKELISC